MNSNAFAATAWLWKSKVAHFQVFSRIETARLFDSERLPLERAVLMAQTTTPCEEPDRNEPRKSSAWSDFLRRLAFWKVTKQEKLDHLFTDVVNELHPEWEIKRQAKKAV
jgi:hypothetical protein